MRVGTSGTEATGKNYSNSPATPGTVFTSAGPDEVPDWAPSLPGPPGPAGPSGPAGGTQINYWYHDDPSPIPTYFEILTEPANGVESDDSVSITSASGEVLIEAYATNPGIPGVTNIPAGNWTFFTYCYASVLGVAQVVLRIYKRTTLGIETELFNLATPNILTSVPIPVLTNYTAPNIPLDVTDVLVVKAFAKTSVPFATVIHFVHDGTLHASWFSQPSAPASRTGLVALPAMLAMPLGSNLMVTVPMAPGLVGDESIVLNFAEGFAGDGMLLQGVLVGGGANLQIYLVNTLVMQDWEGELVRWRIIF